MASVEAMVMVDDGTVVPKNMVMRWTPVTDKLPEDDRPVLVTEKWSEDPFTAKYINGHWFDWYDNDCSEFDGILAWMPLPPVYRPIEEDVR